MRTLLGASGLALIAALACACSSKGGPPAPAGSAAPSAAVCEHGVAKELCPQCNPSLVALYQGNGDWCAEHTMPESFCPICHPELSGRPAADAAPKKPPAARSGTKAPANGVKVHLKSEAVIEGAGLTTVTVVKAPDKTATHFPTRLVYDATRTAELTASAGGVVRSVTVDLGAKVKAGDVLATLDSAEVGGDRSKLTAAYRRLKIAEERLERLSKLEKDGVVPLRERMAAETTVEDARSEAAALASGLGVAGASAGTGSAYGITSPINGLVTRRSAAIGKLVEARDPLFQVVDPSFLWAELDVPETSLASVPEGAEVVFTFPAAPDLAFAGTVSTILAEVDPHTRTVTARVALKNEGLRLKANMFGDAAVLSATPPGGVMLPRTAIQTVDRTTFAFVRKGPLDFEVRHVQVGSRDGALALATAGLEAGEEVVNVGSFLLKTETLKDSIGAGCCGDD